MPTVYMYDVPKSWSDELIGMLLNKRFYPLVGTSCLEEKQDALEEKCGKGSTNASPIAIDGDAVIERLRHDKPPDCEKYAQVKLTFQSDDDLEWTIQSYQSIAVPMTHGYHHFSFSFNEDQYEPYDGIGGSSESPSVRDMCRNTSCPSPPLHLQLMALSTDELEERIGKLKNDGDVDNKHLNFESSIKCSSNEKRKNNKKAKKLPKHCKVYRHAFLAKELGSLLGHRRPTIEVDGIPISEEYSIPLLNYLKTTNLWPPKSKQRKGVNSGNYLTIRQKHPDEMNDLWQLCKSLFHSIYRDEVRSCSETNTELPHYTALAITKNFRGSPHIDKHDTTFQHVVALGDFDGGRLCVDDDTSVVSLNVHNRIGRIDGRNVHWVAGFEGERYSIVYYSTSLDHFTELTNQNTHNQWMVQVKSR